MLGENDQYIKGHILYASTYTVNTRIAKFRVETESRLEVMRDGREEGMRRYQVNGYRVSVWVIEILAIL